MLPFLLGGIYEYIMYYIMWFYNFSFTINRILNG